MRENNVVGFVTFHLIYLLPNDPIIKLFEKIAHMSVSKHMYLCGFVALSVWMFVAGAS